MSAIAGPIIDQIANALENAQSAGSSSEPTDVAIIQTASLLESVADGLVYVFGQVKGAWLYIQGGAKQIGHDFEQIQGDLQQVGDHIINVILPHSMAYLAGYIYSRNIAPILGQIDKIDTMLRSLQAELTADTNYIDQTVKPDLSQLFAFMDFVNKTDQPAINVLIDWLAHPGDFGNWAAAPVIGPVIAYLADPAHNVSRDNLSLIMVKAWIESPEATWQAVLDWFVNG